MTTSRSSFGGAHPGAIIIGGHFQGLGVARSLARHGVPVCIVDSDHNLSRASRFVDLYRKGPSVRDQGAFLGFLLTLAQREGLSSWLIYPTDDEGIHFLSRHRDQLDPYFRVTTPPWETVKYTYHKALTHRLAEEVGIPIPTTWYPQNTEDLDGLDVRFPVIIKPAVMRSFFRVTHSKVFRANDREELRRMYHRACEVIDPSEIMVQDIIPGTTDDLYSYCPLVDEGRVLASVTARRARQHPMDFGHASTYAETVSLPEAEDLGQRFLSAINFSGLAEVEFIRDPRDGQLRLIDINARVWGWHTLAIRAGVDLPYLLYRHMTGARVPDRLRARTARWVHMVTDLPTVLEQVLRRRMSLGSYLSSLRGNLEFAVLSKWDPLPFVMELALVAYLWRKRGF